MATAGVAENQEKLFLGREASAKLLGVSTRTIDDAVKAGTLAAFRIGRRVLIRKDELIRFAEATPA